MAAKKSAPKQPPSIELRRWCIESAIRWPAHEEGQFSAGTMSVSVDTRRSVDADVIGRAKKIEAWVLGKS